MVAHIKEGADDALLGLHGYLFPSESPAPEGPEARVEAAGGIWQQGYFRLFLSHSSRQKEDVGELRRALRAFGIDGFVAHDNIEPTVEWQAAIETALRTCEAFVTYLTPDFHPSKWTDQEVGVALGRALLVIPIQCGTMPYGFLGKYQALNGVGKEPSRLAQDIDRILSGHQLTKERLRSAKSSLTDSLGKPISPIEPAVRSSNKLRRLEEAGFVDLLKLQQPLWSAMAKDAYAYTARFVRGSGSEVRPDDVVPTLEPALEVSDTLRSFRAEQQLSQHHWYTWFAELIVETLWSELRGSPVASA